MEPPPCNQKLDAKLTHRKCSACKFLKLARVRTKTQSGFSKLICGHCPLHGNKRVLTNIECQIPIGHTKTPGNITQSKTNMRSSCSRDSGLRNFACQINLHSTLQAVPTGIKHCLRPTQLNQFQAYALSSIQFRMFNNVMQTLNRFVGAQRQMAVRKTTARNVFLQRLLRGHPQPKAIDWRLQKQHPLAEFYKARGREAHHY